MNLHDVMQQSRNTKRKNWWLNLIRFIALRTDLTLAGDDEKKQRGKKNIYTQKHRKQWAYVINIENYRQLNSQDHGSREINLSSLDFVPIDISQGSRKSQEDWMKDSIIITSIALNWLNHDVIIALILKCYSEICLESDILESEMFYIYMYSNTKG